MKVGECYGAYRLGPEIDSGGMASVHIATHVRLGHVVAIKILHPHFQKDEFLRSRFVDEARIQANLVHENILTVRDILELPRNTAIVMDLLRGVTLKQYFKHAGLPLQTRRVLGLYISICDGLEVAHRGGIVHRDLKPSNIFLHLEGGRIVPKIMDFGVAKHQWIALKEQNTATGTVLGTPHYMAPEQYDDASAVERQADVFSMGVMLFEATTGRVPFEGRRTASMLASILTRPVPKPSGIQINYPVQLEEVILRSLEKDPSARYKDAAALREALLAVADTMGREEVPPEGIPEPLYREHEERLKALQESGSVDAEFDQPRSDRPEFWEGTLIRPVRDDDSREQLGTLLSGFQVQEVVLERDSTVIFRCIAMDDGSPVLLKGHRKEIPDIGDIARIRHEFQLLRKLDIEGVPRARELLKYQNGFLMVLDDEGGTPLVQLLEGGALDLRDGLAYGLRLAALVTRLHARDIIHRQITPDNVLVNPGTGVVELLDFGMASTQAMKVPRPGAAAALEQGLRYMSPEQTGLVNRSLDYRTDFYSLGATLYHALVGAPPFAAEDPEELMRQVLQEPLDPSSEVAARVPVLVMEILRRLMAKDPASRYQSGRGLQADLERCLRQLLTGGGIQPFQLGAQDVSERFLVPQNLVGREAEVQVLQDSFARVRAGSTELLLVAGKAGIGKTALVGEILEPVTSARGIYLEGKFDQYTRDIPYGAIVEAFSRLIMEIVAREMAEQEDWRTKILEALGPNVSVISEVAPKLELLMGPLPPAPKLAPAEARNRFLLAVHNLVGVFATAEHPVVMFLDDLQWADAASLRLIVHMTTARERHHFLLIGAFRDNEVDASHPLRATMDEIENFGLVPELLELGPLAFSAVVQLVAETVDRSFQEVDELAAVLSALSGGNPFFLGLCLRTMYKAGWISFQLHSARWTWDLDGIRGTGDDMMELLRTKIEGLPEGDRHALRVAACVGNHFDLLSLALALELRAAEVLPLLKEAVEEQLIVGLGESFRYFDLEETGDVEEVPDTLLYGAVGFRFSHDRIQQAAYDLFPEEERARIHWGIGQLLLRGFSKEDRESRIFAVVNQLNSGRSLASDTTTRRELAEYNLIAARRAKASTAYRTAYQYLLVALDLCDQDTWRDQKALALDVHVEAAEAAYLSTEFEAMERFVDTVLERTTSLEDKLRVYEVQIQGDISRARKREAIRTGLRVLGLLGVRIPESPSWFDISVALTTNRLARSRRSIEALADLPEMTDTRMLQVMRIASHLNSTAYVVAPRLFVVLVLKQTELSARYGNTHSSAYAYALQGTIAGGILGRWTVGYRYGRMALELMERTGEGAYETETVFTVAGTSQHFHEHLSATLEPLLKGYRRALESGNFEFVGTNTGVYVYYRFYSGAALREVMADAANYAEVIDHVKQNAYYHYTRLYQQVMLNLLGEVEDPLKLQGRAFDEDVQLPRFLEIDDGHGVANLMLMRMILQTYLGEPGAVLDAAKIARPSIMTFAGMIMLPVYHFYHALAALKLLGQVGHLSREERWHLRRDMKKLERWTRHAPENMEHKWLMVRGEYHRVWGRERQAVADYDRAIELAGTQGYVQEQALANELAARFYLTRDRVKLARPYLADAWQGYVQWGAVAKLRLLEAEFPELTRSMKLSLGGGQTTRGTGRTPRTKGHSSVTGGAGSREAPERILELRKELHWDQLVSLILNLAIEETDADRAVLVLRRQDRVVVEAEVTRDGGDSLAARHTLLRDRDDLAIAVVARVLETGLPVYLRDASSEGAFQRDAYVSIHRIRSILCLPLSPGERSSAALYLERPDQMDVFSVKHISAMEVLAAEAGMALDNALKYKALADQKRDLEIQLFALTEDQHTRVEADEDERG